jgi:hypothetical protein
MCPWSRVLILPQMTNWCKLQLEREKVWEHFEQELVEINGVI